MCLKYRFQDQLSSREERVKFSKMLLRGIHSDTLKIVKISSKAKILVQVVFPHFVDCETFSIR